MGEQDRIIAEQRDQLMRLRAENERLKNGLPLSQLRALATMYEPKQREGKTVGFKLSDECRERIMAQKTKLGARSYRQIVQTCVEVGLREIEKVQDGEGSVEAVPEVQRSNGQGDSPVRASAVG